MNNKPKSFLKPWHTCVGALLFGLFAGVLFAHSNHYGIILPKWIFIIFVLIVGVASIWYWRHIDETAKEAHKFSWYWGSSFGIALVVVFCVFSLAGLNTIHMFAWVMPDTPTPHDIFFAGIYAAVLAQVLCYGIVWIFWWLRMRYPYGKQTTCPARRTKMVSSRSRWPP